MGLLQKLAGNRGPSAEDLERQAKEEIEQMVGGYARPQESIQAPAETADAQAEWGAIIEPTPADAEPASPKIAKSTSSRSAGAGSKAGSAGKRTAAGSRKS